MQSDLLNALYPTTEVVPVSGDTLPRFDELIVRPGGDSLTIAPPLDEQGRGCYVSNSCAPMASKKSYHSRLHAWSRPGVTVVVAVRVSYALNSLAEWKDSAPNGAQSIPSHPSSPSNGCDGCSPRMCGMNGVTQAGVLWCTACGTSPHTSSARSIFRGLCREPRSVR
jgi:hypothetical protein